MAATSTDVREEPSDNPEMIYEPIVEVLVVPMETQVEDDSENAVMAKIYSTLLNWTSPVVPDLLDHWQREDIDFILTSAASDMSEESFKADGAAIIRFLAASGYRDEPPLDEAGRPIERRVTALHLVDEARYSYGGHTDTDRQLFRDLFLIYDRFDVNYVDPRGWSHFRAACEFGFADSVEKFLVHGRVDPDSGLDPDTKMTHLQTAMFHKHWRVVELLLRHGADPNLRNEDGYTPLRHIATTLDDDPTKVELLFETCRELGLRLEVDAPGENGETAFHQALENGNLKIAESLLGYGADPRLARREDGQTPLHIVCVWLNHEELQRFSAMRYGGGEAMIRAQLGARDKLGNTPLHLAVQRGPEEKLVEPLLRLGADPNAANELGETPLHRAMAASCPDARTIELLLRRGADFNARARDGSTPLHVLCRGEDDDDDRLLETLFRVSEELSDEPMPIDARDGSARTALQLAVASLKPNCVRALLSRGADLASFLFPDEDYFGATFEPLWLEHEHPVADRTALRLASSALACVEQLERSGRYELDRDDLLTIVKFCCKHGLFRVRMRGGDGLDDDHWRDPEFAQRAKECTLSPCLSLHDLTSVGCEAAARLVTHAQFCKFDLAAADEDRPEYDELRATFLAHLFARMSAGFFCRRLGPLLRDPHPLWLHWLAESEFYRACQEAAAREQDKGCRRAIKFL